MFESEIASCFDLLLLNSLFEQVGLINVLLAFGPINFFKGFILVFKSSNPV